MKTKSILFVVCFALSIQAQAQKCDCPTVFEAVIKKVANNYLQLKQMQIAGKANDYEQRVKAYRQKVKSIASDQCTAFLNDFLDYFQDRHLFVFEYPKYTEQQLEVHKKRIQSQKKTTEQLSQMVQQQQGKHPLIGYWTDGKSLLAIITEQEKYNAYILKNKDDASKTGELLAQLHANQHRIKATYNTYKYTPRYIWGGIYKENTSLRFSGGIAWTKVKNAQSAIFAPKLPTIQKLDDHNTLFTIPSFSVDYKKFVQLVKANRKLLLNSKNLIFDIRGNTGGNAVYFTFLDMYANQTLKGGQGLVLASKATKRYFEQFAKRNKIYKPVVKRITANMGAIVDGPQYPNRKYKAARKSKIKNVAILTDHGCMSAAESFILHSKGASTKVTTFGSPTAGVIDYTSVTVLKLPTSGDQRIYFGFPTSSLHKQIPQNGYNKTGIKPDVPIENSEKDKIKFIRAYFNRK
ncbi:MAG TPA: hypothetical protein DCS93_42330 [Microscillaceae bacterium]|nr:hypothetical protein [Microscillaceae bacterium]